MAAASGCAVWAYACALLLLAATANCTVTYYALVRGTPDGPKFSATLDDNGVRECAVTDVIWDNPLPLDCGSSGYAATAVFGQVDSSGYVKQTVTMTRPGFSGSFVPSECVNCDCGSNDCATWSGFFW